MSKGLIILISGIVLLIGTLIWIYKDNKNKDVREDELLNKIKESRLHDNNLKVSINDDTEVIGDSTELLYDSTELLDETEVI